MKKADVQTASQVLGAPVQKKGRDAEGDALGDTLVDTVQGKDIDVVQPEAGPGGFALASMPAVQLEAWPGATSAGPQVQQKKKGKANDPYGDLLHQELVIDIPQAGGSGSAPDAATKPEDAAANTEEVNEPAPAPAPSEVEETPADLFHTVAPGDWLSKLAKQYYGDMTKWPVIFAANADQIANPDLIFPGQVLRIPSLKPKSEVEEEDGATEEATTPPPEETAKQDPPPETGPSPLAKDANPKKLTDYDPYGDLLHQELVIGLPVASPPPPATTEEENNDAAPTPSPSEVEETPADLFHTVVPGDWLSKLAKQYYGDADKWPVIFEANKDRIADPDLIYPGQVFRIPSLKPKSEVTPPDAADPAPVVPPEETAKQDPPPETGPSPLAPEADETSGGITATVTPVTDYDPYGDLLHQELVISGLVPVKRLPVLMPDVDPTTEDPVEEQDNEDLPSPEVWVTPESIEINQRVHFDFDKATIKEESFPILNEVATVINAHPDIGVVRVDGHTDWVGTAAYNQTLSEKRAQAVRLYLIGRGVPGERLQSKGFGESMPIDTNKTAAGRAANRRVEFTLLDAPVDVGDGTQAKLADGAQGTGDRVDASGLGAFQPSMDGGGGGAWSEVKKY